MAENSLVGRQLANFRIERLIGHGGMAQVYYGQDVSLRRPVAIKIIDARFRGHASYAERFVREAQTVATWRHEHILQVFYADQEDGLYYFVMEYIDGLDLGQLLADYTADGELMPFDDVLRIGRAIASALDYAHERGVIHRDVKPSNVMISNDDRVVLTDFGLAMDVQQGSLGEIFGTPHYIAPEQARRSADAVPQSDLYALGVMLYEMLTGVVPFDDPSAASLALQHMTLPPPSPREKNADLNAKTEQILLKALSKAAAERYQTGADLIAALEASLQTDPVATDEIAALPPIPVGAGPLSLSRQTVAERVAEYVSATHTPAAFPEPLIAATEKSPSKTDRVQIPSSHSASPTRRRTAGIIVGLISLVAIVLIGAIVTLTRDDGDTSENTMGATVDDSVGGVAVLPPVSATSDRIIFTKTSDVTITSAPPPVETEIVSTATIANSPTQTQVEPTQVVLPSATATTTVTDIVTSTATLTATHTATATATATATNAITPTVTATATVVPKPVQTLEPTVLYPGGGRFELFYDANTLIILNLSGDKVALQSFAFERLGQSDVPLNRFEGWRWAQFYGYIHFRSCVRLLVADGASFLNPSQCANYNSEVWPERGLSLDFFTPQEGSTHFRVLWDGEEIGRCEISVSECVVYIP